MKEEEDKEKKEAKAANEALAAGGLGVIGGLSASMAAKHLKEDMLKPGNKELKKKILTKLGGSKGVKDAIRKLDAGGKTLAGIGTVTLATAGGYKAYKHFKNKKKEDANSKK